MHLRVLAPDGVPLHAEITGSGKTALIFVHGWLGSGRWWDAQRDAFSADSTVVQVDLAGHGASGGERTAWSVEAYAGDIEAIVSKVEAEKVVLIGHSMSGASVLWACTRISGVKQVVLVDTLKNLEEPLRLEKAQPMLELYRKDFRHGVLEVLPKYLFGPKTPPPVIERLNREFLKVPGDRAAMLVEPLYRFDLQLAARAVKVPVRAINSDLQPTNLEGNRRFFSDYDVELMPGVGHYPMLEAPAVFNQALRRVLQR